MILTQTAQAQSGWGSKGFTPEPEKHCLGYKGFTPEPEKRCIQNEERNSDTSNIVTLVFPNNKGGKAELLAVIKKLDPVDQVLALELVGSKLLLVVELAD